MTNRMTSPPDARKVIVGVDTHKHVHVAVAIDTWGIRLGDQSFRGRFGGLPGPDHVGRDTRVARGVRHRRHRQLWRRPGACGASSGASCRGSQSGRPAYASRRGQVRHHRCRGRRAVRVGGSVDGHSQDCGRRRRDDAPAQDHAGYRGEGAHHGDEHAEADHRARPARTARSPSRPHRSRPAHALRPTPTGSHRCAHRISQAHPPGAGPTLDRPHR